MIRLLTPQSPARVTWELRLIDTLALLWECDRGDASGFLDAHPAEVDELYAGGSTTRQAASVLNYMDAGL